MIFESVAIIVCFLPFPNRENKIFTKLSGNNFFPLGEFRDKQQVSKLWHKKIGEKITELGQKYDITVGHGTVFDLVWVANGWQNCWMRLLIWV